MISQSSQNFQIKANENAKNFQIEDRSSLHRYRTEIPNILLDMELDPYELSLYLHLKRIAGDNGACFTSNKKLVQKTKICDKKIRVLKKTLSKKGLIKITARMNPNRSKDTDLIQIIDLWPSNFSHFQNKGGGEFPNLGEAMKSSSFSKTYHPVSHTGGVRYHIPEGPVPHTDKEELYKKEHNILGPKSKSTQKPKPNPKARKLAEKLFSLVNKNFKLSLAPNLEKWSEEMDKIMRIDKRTHEEIDKIIELSQSHSYWKSRIRSAAKLRQYYAECFLQLSEKKSNSAPKQSLARAIQEYQSQYPGLDKVVIKEKYVENSRTKRKIYFNSKDFELELRESFDIGKIDFENIKKKLK